MYLLFEDRIGQDITALSLLRTEARVFKFHVVSQHDFDRSQYESITANL